MEDKFCYSVPQTETHWQDELGEKLDLLHLRKNRITRQINNLDLERQKLDAEINGLTKALTP